MSRSSSMSRNRRSSSGSSSTHQRGQCHMGQNSRPCRLLSVLTAVLTLVAGCATLDGSSPIAERTMPKEAPKTGIERGEPQTADQRAWIENACPRGIMGPGPWKRCAERNLRALQAGLPDLTALANADRAWIENACPRGIMGPGPWKRCAERNLRALQAGLPDLTALASADRAWIEKACPREIMGPSPWKRCAERNLQALEAGLPDLTAHASGASQNPTSVSRVDHNDGGASTVATRAEPRRIVEEMDRLFSTGHTTAKAPPDPPRLAAPVNGERWFCYTNVLFSLSDRSPEIVLTREGKTDQPIGKGRVLVADVIYDAIFRIEGIDRRWDWSDGMDSISVNPGGTAAYFNFRLLEPGKTLLPPTQILWCSQK